MNYIEVINEPKGGELGGEKIVALTGAAGPLQIQITNDYETAHIDLFRPEVEELIKHLQLWVDEKHS